MAKKQSKKKVTQPAYSPIKVGLFAFIGLFALIGATYVFATSALAQ